MNRVVLALAGVLVLAAFAWAAFERHVGGRLQADHEALKADTAKTLGEVDQKDEAIRAMSRRIADLSSQADAARARALAAERGADVARGLGADLASRSAALEREGAARPAPRGRKQALDALAALGYPDTRP